MATTPEIKTTISRLEDAYQALWSAQAVASTAGLNSTAQAIGQQMEKIAATVGGLVGRHRLCDWYDGEAREHWAYQRAVAGR